MKRHTRIARREIDSIADEIERIEAEVAALGHSFGGAASEEVRAAIRSIRDDLAKVADDAGVAARAGVGAVEGSIRNNPFAGVAIALALGVALASLLRR